LLLFGLSEEANENIKIVRKKRVMTLEKELPYFDDLNERYLLLKWNGMERRGIH